MAFSISPSLISVHHIYSTPANIWQVNENVIHQIRTGVSHSVVPPDVIVTLQDPVNPLHLSLSCAAARGQIEWVCHCLGLLSASSSAGSKNVFNTVHHCSLTTKSTRGDEAAYEASRIIWGDVSRRQQHNRRTWNGNQGHLAFNSAAQNGNAWLFFTCFSLHC